MTIVQRCMTFQKCNRERMQTVVKRIMSLDVKKCIITLKLHRLFHFNVSTFNYAALVKATWSQHFKNVRIHL